MGILTKNAPLGMPYKIEACPKNLAREECSLLVDIEPDQGEKSRQEKYMAELVAEFHFLSEYSEKVLHGERRSITVSDARKVLFLVLEKERVREIYGPKIQELRGEVLMAARSLVNALYPGLK